MNYSDSSVVMFNIATTVCAGFVCCDVTSLARDFFFLFIAVSVQITDGLLDSTIPNEVIRIDCQTI